MSLRFGRPKIILRMVCLIVVAVLIGVAISSYRRPLPSLQPTYSKLETSTAEKVPIPWPGYGQAAVAAQGFGVISTNGSQTPAPTASIAKIITALTLIHSKPLKSGEQGPTITLSGVDVDLYNSYLAKDGSVVAVANGEKISEYQALQAMLLPSANNMADSLAIWGFGSMSAYLTAANDYVSSLGLSNTHVADASGFSENTVSTASDLATIGLEVLNAPVLSDIVSQSKANIPVAGTISNTNGLLGSSGLIGIKTGNTDQAGGCFLFAGERQIAPGYSVKVVGAVLGAPTLGSAMRDSLPILNASYSGFSIVNSIKVGQVIGTYASPWGSTTAIAKNDIKFLNWKNATFDSTAKLKTINVPQSISSVVGEVKTTSNDKSFSSPVILKEAINNPSWKWRLNRD